MADSYRLIERCCFAQKTVFCNSVIHCHNVQQDEELSHSSVTQRQDRAIDVRGVGAGLRSIFRATFD